MQINLKFCSAKEKDIEEIMNILQQARDFLKENGVPQWQDGYPAYEDIMQDIQNGYGYCIIKDNCIAGYCAIQPYEKDYDIIKGNWNSQASYLAIHRVAIGKNYQRQGLTGYLYSQAEKMAKLKNASSLRVDTHEKNKIMQGAVLKNGFKYCGIIYLSKNGEERFAYEKVLK